MKLLITTLCACLIAAPVKAQEQTKAGPVAAGCVVIIVGGVVVVILVKTCKKLFPTTKNTNDPPGLRLGSGSMAGAELHFDGYCQENDVKSIAQYEQLVDGTLSAETVRISLRDEKQSCNLAEFSSQMAGYGIPLDYGTHYAMNGTPVNSWEVPITVGAGEVEVRCEGSIPLTRVIERSYDLVNWTPIVLTHVASCYELKFSDQSEGPQAFYRTRILP